MRNHNLLAFLLSVVLSLPAAHAIAPDSDLRLCAGVWTDRPCDQVEGDQVEGDQVEGDQVEESFGGTVSRSATNSLVTASTQRARFLFNEFDLARLEANHRYKINMDVGSARDLCLGDNVEIEVCRQELDRQRLRLDGFVMHAQKLEAERQNSQAQQNSEASSQPQVIVIENGYDDYWDDRRVHGGSRGNNHGRGEIGVSIGSGRRISPPVMPPPSPPEAVKPPAGGRGKIISMP